MRKRFLKVRLFCKFLPKKRFLFLGLFITVLGIFFYYYQMIFASNISEKAIVYIPKKTNFKELLNILKPVVKNLKTFEKTCELKKYTQKIRSGKYVLKAGMSNQKIINLLRSGKQIPVKIIFNHCHDLRKLAGSISKQIEADSLSLLGVFKDSIFLKQHNFKNETALAMYIPNTYDFFWDTDAQDFRKRMLKEYQNFWNEKRKKQAKQKNLSLNEVAILAAIVQRESNYLPERKIIAGLYLNRLKKGMPLQADPTIIFAMKKNQENIKKEKINRLFYKDLKIKSPYNTYKNKGLPPGLIAMPDISSYEAVLNAPDHNFLYMCADTENKGRHIFAKNFKNHKKNAKKYRKWITQKNTRNENKN